MSIKDLKPLLDQAPPESRGLQLVRILAREILDGRLLPGSVLPGSQSLADALGLRRREVVAALQQLEQEGWVVCRDRSGTYVSETIPSDSPRAWGSLPESTGIPETPAFDLPSHINPVSSLSEDETDLSEGLPDPRLAPQAALARGYRRALDRHGNDLLGKGESRGNLLLRETLAQYLRDHRGLKAKAENLLITRGTPMSLMLIASTLLPHGGDIAVENPGNPAAWEAFRSVAGVRLHPVPVDSEGLNPKALEARLSRPQVDLLYLSPRYQIPTTVALTPERRSSVLALARQHGFAIIEDDPQFDFHGDSGPLPPLAMGDTEGRILHLGSLTHLLAPGLGLGFIMAPRALVDRLARVRQRMDFQGDRVLEWAVADFIRDGDFERHLVRTRQIYTERRKTFLQELHAGLGPGFEVQPCHGGLACWLRTPAALDLESWSRACRSMGVRFRPGSHHDFHGRPLPFVSLGFGSLEPGEAHRIIQIMRESLKAAS